ncbi:membrane protease FtsH catalytic subunit [Pseudopedobacter saltans DSM 12145]|uniref:ATP-dependent zinc metalloprotease FtsH n=1 Tax=Pseudopedobacter saltans (strain ATCC 51119 / DSM 12145 / JCM 21818 / CCUG 39354 / LMG 10337 / NBRC 100064 / NCIMB 13643) TaxID=762903 RepID=F0S9J0_PSESL|nr:ATP-dependent zinc metalloprotease FtsH [Pseudopedobacter saltans]ADY53543.1 membrane protease FtsH catalytic subunit [Pseudopedobacter saltans DSM 12145]
MKENSDNKKSIKKVPGKKIVPKPPKFNIMWVYALIVLAILGVQFFAGMNNAKLITYQKFEKDMLKPGDVEKLVGYRQDDLYNVEVYIKKDRLSEDKYKDVRDSGNFGVGGGPQYLFKDGSFESLEKRLDKSQEDLPEDQRITVQPETRTNPISGWFWTVIFPIILFALLWIFLMRRMGAGGAGGAGGQIFNIGKSKAQLFDKESQVSITFNDVAGLNEAKQEVMEIVDFLKNPKKYTNLGGKIPKGALLVGSPGTGKTLLAKAVAGEAQVPFFSMSGSDFVEMFVGVGASRVRDLFKQAKEKAPCIIFIDEIDAIGRARGKNSMMGGNDERENTLNQLLVEMDGFGTDSGIIIMAATNRADVLDSALLRPGRFDRQIYVDMPDINERKEIFNVHLKPIKLEDGIDINFLAKQTPGFSGADIANLCNEAALIAARKGNQSVTKQDFLDAVDRIIGGLEKKNKIITKEEKRAIAFHEAGHATISWLLKHAHPLIKVTIVPRGQSLGAAWYLPEERSITTTDQILDEMCSALGGRASEQLMFGKISTGALSDLEKVTKQAYAMVSIYGLNEKLGNISYYDSRGQETFTKPYSETTARIIDEEASKIIETQYARALSILTENKENLIKLAERLLQAEVIFKEDLEEIFGKRPYDLESTELLAEDEKKVAEESENQSKENTPVSTAEN